MEPNQNSMITPFTDFQTIELSIEGTNHTSQIPIRASARADVRITELSDNGAWIEMPSRSCAVGHTISLKIMAKTILNQGSEVEVVPTPVEDPLLSDPNEDSFDLTATVDAVEGDPTANSQQVLIRFRQHTPDEWQDLIQYYSHRQAQLNALIQRTRQ